MDQYGAWIQLRLLPPRECSVAPFWNLTRCVALLLRAHTLVDALYTHPHVCICTCRLGQRLLQQLKQGSCATSSALRHTW